jgi:lysozyme
MQMDVLRYNRMVDLLGLRKQLELHEGKRLKAYVCPGGYLTVGVGRNVEANPVFDEIGRDISEVGDSITITEAMTLLDNDIDRFALEVRGEIPCFAELSDIRKQVLIDMAFNLGTAGLLKFKNMLVALDEGDFHRAADEMMDSRWARQVKTRADRLSQMMASDQMPEELVGASEVA